MELRKFHTNVDLPEKLGPQSKMMNGVKGGDS